MAEADPHDQRRIPDQADMARPRLEGFRIGSRRHQAFDAEPPLGDRLRDAPEVRRRRHHQRLGPRRSQQQGENRDDGDTDAQPQRLIRRGAYRQRFFGTRQCTSLSPPLWGAMRQSMAMLRSA